MQAQQFHTILANGMQWLGPKISRSNRRVRQYKQKRPRSKNKVGGQIDPNSNNGKILEYINAHPNCLATDIAPVFELEYTNVQTALRSLIKQERVSCKWDEKQKRRRRYFVRTA